MEAAILVINVSDIINVVVVLASGGMLGIILKHKLASRQQKSSEFQVIVEEYKQKNKELKEDLDLVKKEVAKLKLENDQHTEEISSLRTKLLLFESSHSDLPLPMWMKDRDGKMIFLNTYYEDLLLKPRGYSMSDYVGHFDSSVWPKDIAARFMSTDKKVVLSKLPQRQIEKLVIEAGKTVYLEVLKYPRILNNSVIGINGVVIRMSEHLITLNN